MCRNSGCSCSVPTSFACVKARNVGHFDLFAWRPLCEYRDIDTLLLVGGDGRTTQVSPEPMGVCLGGPTQAVDFHHLSGSIDR